MRKRGREKEKGWMKRVAPLGEVDTGRHSVKWKSLAKPDPSA